MENKKVANNGDLNTDSLTNVQWYREQNYAIPKSSTGPHYDLFISFFHYYFYYIYIYIYIYISLILIILPLLHSESLGFQETAFRNCTQCQSERNSDRDLAIAACKSVLRRCRPHLFRQLQSWPAVHTPGAEENSRATATPPWTIIPWTTPLRRTGWL